MGWPFCFGVLWAAWSPPGHLSPHVFGGFHYAHTMPLPGTGSAGHIACRGLARHVTACLLPHSLMTRCIVGLKGPRSGLAWVLQGPKCHPQHVCHHPHTMKWVIHDKRCLQAQCRDNDIRPMAFDGVNMTRLSFTHHPHNMTPKRVSARCFRAKRRRKERKRSCPRKV